MNPSFAEIAKIPKKAKKNHEIFQNKSVSRTLSKSMIKLFAKTVNGEKPLKAARNLNVSYQSLLFELQKVS